MAKALILEVREDKVLKRRKVQIAGEWPYDSKAFHAWYALRRLFTRLEKSPGMVVDGRYAIPISPWKNERYTPEEIEERTNQDRTIRQAYNYMRQKEARQGQVNVVNWTISLSVVGLVFVFLILALLIASGKISI